MSRDWLALYGAMIAKPKYRRLSPIGRGALLHTFLLAGFQSPEATWRDPNELRESLFLDGFPEGALDELVSLGWLEHEDGALIVHDWDQHQFAATSSIGHQWEAMRRREWRKKKRPPSPSPAPLTPTRQDTTPQDNGSDMSRHVTTPGLEEVVGVYEGLFGFASDKKRLYLASILSRWPIERILEGLRREQDLGATRRNICGRLEAGLKGGDRLTAAATMQLLEGHLAEESA